MIELVIMRGLPGSGKSFYVQNKMDTEEWPRASTKIWSTDAYWVQAYGEYKVVLEEFGKAHGWCFRNAIECLQAACHSTVKRVGPEYETYRIV